MRPGLDFDPSDEEPGIVRFHPRDDPAQRSTSMMTDDAERSSRDYDSAVAELGRDVASGTATANGTTIHYVRGGRGPALVLLHGFPQDWFEWRRLMPRLAESFTVIAIDLRGGAVPRRLPTATPPPTLPKTSTSSSARSGSIVRTSSATTPGAGWPTRSRDCTLAPPAVC